MTFFVLPCLNKKTKSHGKVLAYFSYKMPSLINKDLIFHRIDGDFKAKY